MTLTNWPRWGFERIYLAATHWPATQSEVLLELGSVKGVRQAAFIDHVWMKRRRSPSESPNRTKFPFRSRCGPFTFTLKNGEWKRRVRSSNSLFYGDNLEVLSTHIPEESVDLVYLDPPFNSKANYNLVFEAPDGHCPEAQIEAFEDTWHWNDHAEEAFDQVRRSGNTKAFDLLNAIRSSLGENDMMAYLAMMAVRLL